MKAPIDSASRRRWLRSALLAGAATAGLLGSSPALAEQWPSRPVKLVVGFAAGSSGDLIARLLAPRLEAVWKQPVIVENKPGAGGQIASEYVVASTDGHTLLLGTLSSLLPKYLVKNLRYDPVTDLVPVYRVINFHLALATNAKTAESAKTLKDIVALSKTTPNGLFYSGTGQTSIVNLAFAVISKPLGIKYTTIDFSNIGQMNIAVIRNDAQLLVNSVSSVKAQIDSGEIRPLAALSTERFPSLPDVPTLEEAVGYKGFLPVSWSGLLAPKGTPKPVVDRIGRDVLALLSDAETKKFIESRVSGTILRSSPEAFAKEYQEEAILWKNVFASMNYVPQ